jgi:tetratricopeptide (TPR) repeat protein
LSFLYRTIGDYERALEEGREAVRLAPRNEPPYRNLASAYIRLARIAEAKHVLAEAQRQRLDGARLHYRLLEIGYVDNDLAIVQREIQWFGGKREEYFSLAAQAADADAHGRRQGATELYARAAESARRSNLPNLAAELDEANALADAILNGCQRTLSAKSALARALCGDRGRAERLGGEPPALDSDGTLWNSVELPVIRAATAVAERQPSKAIDVLATASPYERAYPEVSYVRGLAYLGIARGADAAAAFRRILDEKGTAWDLDYAATALARPLIYSLANAGLARACAMSGDTAMARTAREGFLFTWRDATAPPPVAIAPAIATTGLVQR